MWYTFVYPSSPIHRMRVDHSPYSTSLRARPLVYVLHNTCLRMGVGRSRVDLGRAGLSLSRGFFFWSGSKAMSSGPFKVNSVWIFFGHYLRLKYFEKERDCDLSLNTSYTTLLPLFWHHTVTALAMLTKQNCRWSFFWNVRRDTVSRRVLLRYHLSAFNLH